VSRIALSCLALIVCPIAWGIQAPPIPKPEEKPPATSQPAPAPPPAPAPVPAPVPAPAPAPAPAPPHSGAPAPARTAPPIPATRENRAANYQAFRTAFDAGRFDEARPLAENAVAMTTALDGADSLTLVTPLSNLGQTAYRQKDYVAAEQAYLRGVKILETHDAASRRLPRALYVLGKIYRAAGQSDYAAASLRRAVDITRKSEGLFSPSQLAYLNSLIDAYVESGATADADREEQYMMRIAERNYAPKDPLFITALERQARWLESQGRFTTERRTLAQAVDLTRNAGGPADLRQIGQLIAIARSYRLEFTFGPENTEQPQDPRDAAEFGNSVSSFNQTSRINPDAERILQEALKLALNGKGETAANGKIDALVELGDQAWVQNQRAQGEKQYRNAWDSLTPQQRATPGSNPLASPRLLAYHLPPSLQKKSKDEDDNPVLLDVQFSVGVDGKVVDPKVVPGSEAPEAAQKALVSSLRRALYRPRFVEGKPAATEGMHYKQYVYNTPTKSK
jgi:Tetratricopeptide repeat